MSFGTELALDGGFLLLDAVILWSRGCREFLLPLSAGPFGGTACALYILLAIAVLYLQDPLLGRTLVM